MNRGSWLWAVLSFAIVFASVLAALNVDRWMARRESPPASALFPAAIPARLDVQSAPFDFRAASKRVIASVVSIDTALARETFLGERFIEKSGSGSGVIISSEGHIVTNNHVIRDPRDSSGTRTADAVRVNLSDGRSFPAEVVGIDPRSDLALLKINADKLTPIEIGDSKSLEIGEWVIAVGNPYGYSNTVSVGVVSSLGRTLPTQDFSVLLDAIQTDAAINQGNSGGALCNAKGQLVGINTALVSPTGASVGIGFAIPATRVQQTVKDILEYGHPRHAILGVVVDSRDGVLADPRARAELARLTESNSEPPAAGVVILSVGPESPAARAGIRRLDVITQIDGTKIASRIDYSKVMQSRRPGDQVTVTYWSRGQIKTAQLSLAEASR